MKGKFYAPASLMQLEDTLKNHQPYAALAVSTTGLDDAEFVEHSPTRVVLKQYEYDEQTKSYKESIAFDKMVQAPQSAIERAIETADKYDVFANGGIDREAYQKGEGVLSVEDFKKEFDRVVSAIREAGTTLIVNSEHHAQQYLGKIGCADGIKAMADDRKTLDQIRLTQEYFQKHGINEKASLEALRNAILPSPSGSFIQDEAKMKDFRSLSKEEYLKNHPSVSERSYDLTQRDVQNREGKIIGGDNRIAVINAFVIKHGRDEHILESEWKTHMRESDAAYTADMSEKGKKKYQEGDMHDKMSILTNSGAIKPEQILEGDSEFHKLIHAVENKNNKGIIVAHASTTGFERGTAPRCTGQPIQFTALAFQREADGSIDFTKRAKGVEVYIRASDRAVLKAEQQAANGGYDTFKEAGVDVEAYKSGAIVGRDGKKKEVSSPEAATERINEFFNRYPVQDYTLVVMGGAGRNYEKSFTQTAMMNLGNFDMCETDFVDFSQATKDYGFWIGHSDQATAADAKNVMFGDNIPTKFGLKEIAEANGMNVPHTTTERCLFAGSLIGALERQQIELFRPEELEKPASAQEKQISAPVSSANEAIAEENDTPEISEEMARMEREAQAEFFAENLAEITGESHGKLYSDKQNDTVPIVKAEGVQKVGETRIPHISEAFEDTRKPDIRPMPSQEDRPTRNNKNNELENSALRRRRPIRERPASSEQTVKTPVPMSSHDKANSTVRPVASQGVEHLDINQLISVMAMQSETIARQGEIIAQQSQAMQRQNEQLMQLMSEQNRFLETVLTMGQPIQEQQIPAPSKGNMIDYLEHMKAGIDAARTELPTGKARNNLTKANEFLTEGQKAIEQENKQIGQGKAS